jgi:hypothetical protein
MTVKLFSHNT